MRITVMLILVLWGAITLSAHEPLAIPAGHHRILFPPGEENMAARAARVVTVVTDAVLVKYGTALQGFRAEVRLRLPPTEMQSRSGPYSCCSLDFGEGVTIATIAYDGALAGHDDEVALATALMPLAYLAVQTERGDGWMFNDAPEWFIEGLATFDGRSELTLSRQEVRADLVRWKQQHSRTIECCGTGGHTLFVSDQAIGGAAFLAYLAEQFGEDVHARIVRSNSESFTQAFAEETRPYTLKELFDRFTVWE